MLLVVVHHIVFDGWSVGVMLRELTALYEAEVTGEPAGLAELPVQFADYALWERERLQGAALEELARLLARDPGRLPDPAAARPTGRGRRLDSYEGARGAAEPGRRAAGRAQRAGPPRRARRCSSRCWRRFRRCCTATPARTTSWSARPAPTGAGRSSAPLIGFLVNTLPIRTDLSGDPIFAELLGRVREATIGAYAHQDLPFAKLVEELRVERDPSRAPVFQVAMTIAEAPRTRSTPRA